ncbi:MAG: aminopeptidase P N-terminal domain-containing protein [Planctomycetota bacterium]|jgi:Xaa-Pro aminopeptidase
MAIPERSFHTPRALRRARAVPALLAAVLIVSLAAVGCRSAEDARVGTASAGLAPHGEPHRAAHATAHVAPPGAQPTAQSAGRTSTFENVFASETPEDGLLVEPRGSLPIECSQRRMALAAALGEGVIVALAGPPNELGLFFQHDDFYYLSGVEIPDIAIALRVDASGGLADEVLFLPPHDAMFETWNGARLSPGTEAERATGFRRTAPLSELSTVLAEWAPSTIHAVNGVPDGLPEAAEVDEASVRRELSALRLTKSAYEIDCLKNAIEITGVALHAAAAQVGPDVPEYRAQGALEGTFLMLGAERPGFASICGSGPNSVTLHYNANRRTMRDGELIVMDVGAKYRYYCADITRTLPVNGKFSPRQREVYEVVLEAQTAAAEAARPGMTMAQLDQIARDVITQRGFGPGRKYFKHGLGHWIGLDVHDVGGRAPIQPGMLFTIEPGIYITEEALGVRIEDDYLMTDEGAVKLSGRFPSDPDEVEALLAGR